MVFFKYQLAIKNGFLRENRASPEVGENNQKGVVGSDWNPGKPVEYGYE